MDVDQVHFGAVGHVTPDPDWGLPPHSHGFHEMIVVVAGAMEVKIAGQLLRGRNGDVLFYPKGEAHAEQSDPRAPVETLFTAFQAPPAAADTPLRVYDADGRIRVLINWLYAERDSYAPNATALRNALIRAIIAEYVRLCSGKRDELVEKVRAYIHQHLCEQITLEQLAQRAGISKFHFLRHYKQLTGHTPMDDVRAIRLEAARHAILTTNLPLKSIAPRVGLSDEYHLSRLFRKYLNVAPSALRTKVTEASARRHGDTEKGK